MKKIITRIIVAVSIGAAIRPAWGQTTIDVPGFVSLNLNSITQNMGIADFVDNHKRNWFGATERIAWYPNDPNNPINQADLAWIGLEISVPWDTSSGKPAGAFGWLGFRVDTVAHKIIPTKIGHLAIPNLEFGPGGGYLYNLKQWVYFLGFVKHF